MMTITTSDSQEEVMGGECGAGEQGTANIRGGEGLTG